MSFLVEAFAWLQDQTANRMHEVDGRHWWNNGRGELKLVEPTRHTPVPVTVSSLTGFVDYMFSGDTFEENLIVHVVNHEKVLLYTTLDKDRRGRETYAAAYVEYPNGFQFDRFLDPTKFVVGLQSEFVRNEDAELLIKLASNARASKETTSKDDGVSQEIVSRAGAILVENVKIKNPVTLIPHVTFPEVEPPEVEYVVRVDGGSEDRPPHFALYTGTNTQWALKLRKEIQAWLQDEIQRRINDAGEPPGFKWTVIS